MSSWSPENASTSTETTPAPGCALSGVAFGGDSFVLAGDGCALVSADGQIWTRIDPAEPGLDFREVEFGAGSFVAVTLDGEVYQLGEPSGRAPQIDLLRGPAAHPVGPLDHLTAEVKVDDLEGSAVELRVSVDGDVIGESTEGRVVVDLPTRSPGGYEVVVEATDSDGLRSTRAFRYEVNDYVGGSALEGTPAIWAMAAFKDQLYRAGEQGIVQRGSGDGIWQDLPPVPDRKAVTWLFETDSHLYASTLSGIFGSDSPVYRSRDGLEWEEVTPYGGRLGQAGAVTYMEMGEALLLLESDGVFRAPGFAASRIVEFDARYVAGIWSPHSDGLQRRLWVSSDGMDFGPVDTLPGRNWQGPFTAGGQLIVRNLDDGQIRLTSDLVIWETKSLPVDGYLFQAGSGLVVSSGMEVWYSADGRTWQWVSDEGFGGAVRVGEADLLISGKKVHAFKPGQSPVILGELTYAYSSDPGSWKAVLRPDGSTEVMAEGAYAGTGSAAPRFAVNPEVSELEVVVEPRRGMLRGYSIGKDRSAFLISRPDTQYLLLGQDPLTAAASLEWAGNGHELVAENGSIWVVAGAGWKTRITVDGQSWQVGSLGESGGATSIGPQFDGTEPQWLVYHSPSGQFLAGWAKGSSKTGWWRSSDGLTWTFQIVENWHGTITGVVSNGTVLVGMFYGTEVAVCSDGLSWSTVSLGFSPSIHDLRMLSPDIFALHDEFREQIYTSADGRNWVRAIDPTTGGPLRGEMIVSDDLPRILSGKKIWVSQDEGATWEYEGPADYAPAGARHLFWLDGQVYSSDLSSISGLEDLSSGDTGTDLISGGRGKQITDPGPDHQ